jgi:hypothetical protein
MTELQRIRLKPVAKLIGHSEDRLRISIDNNPPKWGEKARHGRLSMLGSSYHSIVGIVGFKDYDIFLP